MPSSKLKKWQRVNTCIINSRVHSFTATGRSSRLVWVLCPGLPVRFCNLMCCRCALWALLLFSPHLHWADDFTLALSTPINTITFFAYQTGSTTTSSFTGVRVRIVSFAGDLSGQAKNAGTVVFGDLTTNRLASTGFTNAYRVVDFTPLDTTRPIMSITATIGVTLPPGSYWVQWELSGTLGVGPFVPPITIIGQSTTGNGVQSVNGAAWSSVVDGGISTRQGFPFLIDGVVAEVGNE